MFLVKALRARRVACILLLTVSALASYGQSLDRRLYQDAENRFRSKDYQVALQKYLELIDEFPLSRFVPDAQFRRAVSLFRLGQIDESLEVFRTVESKYRATGFLPFVPFWIGVISYNEKEYIEASANLSRYLESGETSLLGQARLILAVSENQLGNTDSAIRQLESLRDAGFEEQLSAIPFLASLYVRTKAYESVISLVSNRDTSSLLLADQRRLTLYEAEARWHLDEKTRASELYESLRNTSPDISSVAYQRLFAYYQTQNDEAALQQIVLDAEIELSGRPEVLSEFWLRIGIESYQDTKLDLARSYFQRVWNLRQTTPIDGLVPLYLSELFVLENRHDDATDILELFSTISDSRRELILFRLGGIYLETEQWPLARDRLTTFLDEFPDSRYFSEGSYLLSYSLYRNGERTAALERIDSILTAARSGAFTDRLLRLQSVLFKQVNELSSSVDTLRQYIPLQPGDAPARMDLIKLLFRLKKYAEVIREVELLFDIPPFSDENSPFFLLTQYMYGLSLIDSQNYGDAANALELITDKAVESAGLDLIYPYTLFYRGWAYYRSSEYEIAEENFSGVVDGSPEHELYPRAAYLAGWCAFVIGEYARAERHLLAAESSSDPGLRIKSNFMLAKSLLGQGRTDEAAILFENIYLGEQDAPLADDALFEYAGSLSLLAKLDQSVDTYEILKDVFPSSPLAEESMYKRGELYFDAGRYEEAREAYYEHRISFPRGSLYDAALYWGGMASLESGEPFGAVLLWEKLIESYSDSAFRADSLRRTAEVYEESGDFRKALNYYGEMISVYPEEAEAISADLRAEKLRYLILGQGEREAELSVIIGRDGTETQEGREAILELARIYIFKSGSKQNLAPPFLDQLISAQEVDPSTAAQAQYLYGEYYYRKNDLRRAANEFIKAISIYSEDRDLSAQALFRAAEMAKLSGNIDEAADLVKQIETSFPQSQWVEEGKKLLEESR